MNGKVFKHLLRSCLEEVARAMASLCILGSHFIRRPGAAECHDWDLALGGGAVAGEAWVCDGHFVEQGGAFVAAGNAGGCCEGLAFGFDGDVGVGYGVEVPGGVVVEAVV